MKTTGLFNCGRGLGALEKRNLTLISSKIKIWLLIFWSQKIRQDSEIKVWILTLKSGFWGKKSYFYILFFPVALILLWINIFLVSGNQLVVVLPTHSIPWWWNIELKDISPQLPIICKWSSFVQCSFLLEPSWECSCTNTAQRLWNEWGSKNVFHCAAVTLYTVIATLCALSMMLHIFLAGKKISV